MVGSHSDMRKRAAKLNRGICEHYTAMASSPADLRSGAGRQGYLSPGMAFARTTHNLGHSPSERLYRRNSAMRQAAEQQERTPQGATSTGKRRSEKSCGVTSSTL